MTPQILYENDEVLAINKPSGMVVHFDGKTREYSVADWVLENYPALEHIGEPLILSDGTEIARPGIVHRLDRETSGVLLIAKTQESFEHLKQQFKDRLIQNTYNVFVYGHFKEEDGTIDRPIGRSKNDFRKWSAQRGMRGKIREAFTEYTVLEQGEIDGEKISFLEIHPKTGRTHQIRVHMKAVNHEIVCDSLYAPKKPCVCGLNRLALHAKSIQYHDKIGSPHIVEAELPDDLRLVRDALTP